MAIGLELQIPGLDLGTDDAGNDKIISLLNIDGDESISDCFSFQLEFSSNKIDILAANILYQKVDVRIYDSSDNSTLRYVSAYVNRFSPGLLSADGTIKSYRVQIVPWLWFLSKTSDCKIFQGATALDVIKAVFDSHPNIKSYIEDSNINAATHRTLDYCVQYGETDFDFINRLAKENGIMYFFKHDEVENDHILVLADSSDAYLPCYQDADNVDKLATVGNASTDAIKVWQEEYNFISNKWVEADYNFESSTASEIQITSTVDANINAPTITDEYENFVYPGGFNRVNEDAQADVRIAKEEANYLIVTAKGDYSGLFSGGKLNVDTDSSGTGTYYVVTEMHISVKEDVAAAGATGVLLYENSFNAIPASVLYFTEKKIAKPIMHGPQTAIVVGPENEKVYTDAYGRVKVQFHWDRYGASNESSSCWLRVSQSWAGARWGEVALPHSGNEVIVSFLNGDPDHPIITGRVHNAKQMPPGDPPNCKEKYFLQDDYGNKVMLDATSGVQQIQLNSPKDSSKIEIGTLKGEDEGDGDKTGIRLITDGEIESTVRGQNSSVTSGNAYSVSAGTSFSLFGGATADITGGVAGSLNAGLNYSVGLGGNYTYTVGYTNAWTSNAWINATNSDILNVAKEDVIVGAGDEICIVANCKDTTNERSIFYANADKMSLSMGNQFEAQATGPHNTWYEAYGGVSGWDVGILAGAATSSGLAAIAFALAASDNNKGAHYAGTAAGAAFLATLLAAGYEWWANNRDAAIEPIEHVQDAEALKIELNKNDGISVKSKEKLISLIHGETDKDSVIALENGVGIRFGTVGMIAIDDTGKISITSEADIVIESQSNIDLIAKKKVRAKGEAFDYNGVMKHKNFEVLS